MSETLSNGAINMISPLNFQNQLNRGCEFSWPHLRGISHGSRSPNIARCGEPSQYAAVGAGVGNRDGWYCTSGNSVDCPVRVTDLVQFTVRVVFTPISWPGAFTALLDQSTRQFSVFVGTTGNISFVDGNDGQHPILSVPTGIGGFTPGKRWDLVFSFSQMIIGVQNGWMRVYANSILIAEAERSSYGGTADLTLDWQLGANPSGGGTAPDIIYHELQVWPTVGLNYQSVRSLYIEGQQRYPTVWNHIRPYTVFDVGGGGMGVGIGRKLIGTGVTKDGRKRPIYRRNFI